MTSSHPQASYLSRLSRAVGLRVLMVFCVAVYSIWGMRMNPVVVHHHDESHVEHHVEMHYAPDSHPDDHEDHQDGENGEHHHHLSYNANVAMASVTPSNPAFFQRFTELRPTSFDEVCPSGPVFEWIKPPQVS